jgi:type II secretory pathway pseudopilin PulG
MTRHVPTRAPRPGAAFTLIEMIGVLAVVAILASLLIPTIFEVISNARLNETVAGCHTLKTAAMEHYAKFGSLASSNGTPLAFSGSLTNFDQVLLAEGLIDKPFASRLGASATVRIVEVSGLTSSTTVNAQNGAYDLDGDGKNDVVGAASLVEAVITDVPLADARALNDRLDGDSLGETSSSGQNDWKGRVIYHRPVPSRPFEVHVYLTHR